jgi:hypothetical protein
MVKMLCLTCLSRLQRLIDNEKHSHYHLSKHLLRTLPMRANNFSEPKRFSRVHDGFIEVFCRVFRRWRNGDAPWAGWCDAGASMTVLVTPEQPASRATPRDTSTGAVTGLRPLHIVSRIGAALLGGYAFTWGLSVLGIAAGVAAGVPYDEATTRMMLPAFLVYLGAFLWAFAGKRLWLIWAVLLGCGAAMTGAAWLWQRALLS